MEKAKTKLRNVIVACILFVPASVSAEYCAVEKIEGNVCVGFIIESCKFVQVDAVKDDEGQLYEINRCYNSVSEYNKSKGRCWIRTKSKGGGLLSWGINAATQPEFFVLSEDGSYEELDIEYLTFKCVER